MGMRLGSCYDCDEQFVYGIDKIPSRLCEGVRWVVWICQGRQRGWRLATRTECFTSNFNLSVNISTILSEYAVNGELHTDNLTYLVWQRTCHREDMPLSVGVGGGPVRHPATSKDSKLQICYSRSMSMAQRYCTSTTAKNGSDLSYKPP